VVPIEAKNRVGSDSKTIAKEYAGQLTQSAKWAADTFPERKNHVPVMAHRSVALEASAFPPDGTRILSPTGIVALLRQLAAFVTKLSETPADQCEVATIEAMLVSHKLTLPQVLSAFTVLPK
jgi:hypothetical protein